jgi:hypothetical protein
LQHVLGQRGTFRAGEGGQSLLQTQAEGVQGPVGSGDKAVQCR